MPLLICWTWLILFEGPSQSIFDLSLLAEIAPDLLQMLVKFNHVFTSIDVRLHF